MSSENELNKALAELYSDLEKLQSARKQVEIVTESSNELAKSTSTLINQISEFTKQLGMENSSNITNLNDSLVQFETQTNDLKNFTKNAIEQMLSIAIKKIEEQEQKISKTIESIDETVNSNYKNLSKNYETKSNELNEFLRKSIEQIQELALNNINEQEQKISKTIQYIEKSNSKTESLIEIISKWDIPKSLEQINQKFDSQKNINNFFLILILLLSVVGSISSILVFLK